MPVRALSKPSLIRRHLDGSRREQFKSHLLNNFDINPTTSSHLALSSSHTGWGCNAVSETKGQWQPTLQSPFAGCSSPTKRTSPWLPSRNDSWSRTYVTCKLFIGACNLHQVVTVRRRVRQLASHYLSVTGRWQNQFSHLTARTRCHWLMEESRHR